MTDRGPQRGYLIADARLGVRALPTLLVVILFGACSVEEPPGPSRPSAPIPSSRPLPAQWYADSDRNTIPDFVERDEGYDPARDDCLPDRCQDKDQAAVDQLLDQGQNTLLVLDSSGSMAGSAGGGETKIEAAKDAIATYARAAPPDIDHLGFAVYGHRGGRTEAKKVESCRGVDILAGIDKFGARSARRVLARFSPLGFTPVAGALRRSRDAFRGREGELNRVVLVSDGVETCGGDPVAAARTLRESGDTRDGRRRRLRHPGRGRGRPAARGGRGRGRSIRRCEDRGRPARLLR